MIVLVDGTEIQQRFADKEVKRDWYYRWLSRATRLKTANLSPLEITRAQWATSANVLKHYDQLAAILVELKLAVPNKTFDPEEPYGQQIIITKPERIFSMHGRDPPHQ